MKLKKLIKDLSVEIRGSKDVEITGICSDSRRICPGNLFIAKKGAKYDGAQFIAQAVENGAVAILSDFFDPFLKKTQVLTSFVSSTESELNARFYNYPSNELYLIGITGTNGKTTTSYFIKHLLDHISCLSGLIGTNEYVIGSHHLPSTLTTPPIDITQKMLREMCSVGCKSAVMEVSSHSLDQNRIEGLDFDVAIFCNLSQEHLDYHKSMEKYAEAKKKLFESLKNSSKKNKLAIYNMDDPWHEVILQEIPLEKLSFGINEKADVMAKDILCSDKDTKCNVQYKQNVVSFELPFLGKMNVYNLLAAICVGLHKGLDLKKISTILKNVPLVKGRLQRIEKNNKTVFIDFAHTPYALQKVLTTLKEIKKNKLILVFGCGGDRDKEKRQKMGEIAEKLSDYFFITNDNPRSEDPHQIVEQILQGVAQKNHHTIELDRKEAIRKAIAFANPEDIILIAGKGHEKKQIFSHRILDFDDVEITTQLLNK